MSLPSRGVSGARPLLESPVEEAGLSPRAAKGLLGMLGGLEDVGEAEVGIDGNIVELLCRGGIPGARSVGEEAVLLLPAAAALSAVARSMLAWLGDPGELGFPPPLAREVGVTLPEDDDDDPKIEDEVVEDGISVLLLFLDVGVGVEKGFRDDKDSPRAIEVRVICPDTTRVSPRDVLGVGPSVPAFLGNVGLEVTLNAGGGARCLMGIGAILSRSWELSLSVTSCFLSLPDDEDSDSDDSLSSSSSSSLVDSPALEMNLIPAAPSINASSSSGGLGFSVAEDSDGLCPRNTDEDAGVWLSIDRGLVLHFSSCCGSTATVLSLFAGPPPNLELGL
jgi:hypothetical protein